MSYNEEIKTNYGTVRNVNFNNVKKTKKRKTYKMPVMIIAATSILLVSAFIAKNKNIPTSPIPENQVKTYITMEVEDGDTISDITNKFYTEDNETVYNSISNYKKEIEEQNNISKFDSHIENGEVLKVPVIVDKDNPYYLEILEIKSKISDIEENNLWVRYTVKYGDRISTLAELASGSYSETYEIASEIERKNNYGRLLNEGEEIWIMNPELGKLKSKLKEAEEQFKESLINKQIKK